MAKLLLTVLYFTCMVIGVSSTLQCYVCNGCNDDFKPSHARNATCLGSCGKTKREDSGYVVRFCNRVYIQEPKCETLDSAGSEDIEVCACNTNLCNSASLTEISLLLQTVCVTVVFITVTIKIELLKH